MASGLAGGAHYHPDKISPTHVRPIIIDKELVDAPRVRVRLQKHFLTYVEQFCIFAYMKCHIVLYGRFERLLRINFGDQLSMASQAIIAHSL